MDLFLSLPAPPDPLGLIPEWDEYLEKFKLAAGGKDPERLEESFLAIYEYLHGNEAPYSTHERSSMDSVGGYWNHAGGIKPVIMVPDYLRPNHVSADFGAGNGLQCLLMQALSPHARSVQVEISSAEVEFGKQLQSWLGIDEQRVDWRVGDVMQADFSGIDLIYMYRPVRPQGPGKDFYRRMARQLVKQGKEVVVFSIADCLRDFLPEESYEIVYSDGQLTCLKIHPW